MNTWKKLEVLTSTRSKSAKMHPKMILKNFKLIKPLNSYKKITPDHPGQGFTASSAGIMPPLTRL
jgi:hypothetical protein